MHEVVIVAATRSPIGRAVKGSLTQIRPDDLAAQIVHHWGYAIEAAAVGMLAMMITYQALCIRMRQLGRRLIVVG